MWLLDKIHEYARRTRAFIDRHRTVTAILASFVVVGGGVWLSFRYLKHRLLQMTNELKNEQLAKMKMQSFFEHSLSSCDKTIESCLVSLKKEIITAVEVPTTQELSNSMHASQEEKLKLWEQTKVNSFVRTISGLYAVCLLATFVRLQVSLIGKYLYIESITRAGTCHGRTMENFDPGELTVIDPVTQASFLGTVDYFISTGVKKLVEDVAKASEAILKEWPIHTNKKCGYQDFISIINSIRQAVEVCCFLSAP